MKITIEGIERTDDGSTVHVIENVKCLAGVFVEDNGGCTFERQNIVQGGFSFADRVAVGEGLDAILEKLDWHRLKPIASIVLRHKANDKIGEKTE